MTSLAVLAGFFLASGMAASSGAIFRPGPWYYQELRKPPWTPPPWLFAPAWTVLYITMSVAAWLVWREGGVTGMAGIALAVFLGHLVLNAIWSWLFFGRERPDLAFLELILLWSGVLACVLLFWSVRPVAGAIMLPYLAWVTFAGALNLRIWQLNPRSRGRGSGAGRAG
ncbi:MAG: tryptophan-rich sensory protein [Gemmatimonadales bacterium]|nr:MAG: tryptophan-rich sensory protein [Gemmatimonadales bacterium]